MFILKLNRQKPVRKRLFLNTFRCLHGEFHLLIFYKI